MASRRGRSAANGARIERPVAARERMSAVDAAWWHMDRPHNPMVSVGMLLLRRAPTLKAPRGVVDERLLAQPRFRERPVHAEGADFWELDARFRLERLVVRQLVARPAGDAELEALAAQQVGRAARDG